jgi:DNA repair exonuclease SbcCD ATPase subunit
MRLRRLTLTDVAGVDASELVVPEQGVSVVLAPNETGKSTLLRAYKLLLDKTGHTGKTAEVRSLQPVGRDVGSTIGAELVIGDETFVVERTYNRQARSSVTVHGKNTVTKTGKEADDLLRSRFLSAVDQDLYGLLMFEQGRALESLNGAASTTVMGALQDSDAPSPGGGDGVIDALRKRVGKAFHARNDTLIGELKKLQTEVEDAEARRDELAGRIASLIGGTSEDDVAGTIAELRESLVAISQRIERAGAAARAVTAKKLLDASSEQVRQRKQQIEQLERLSNEEKELAGELAKTTKDLAALTKQVADLEKKEAAATKERAGLVAAVAQAEANLIAAIEAEVAELKAAVKREKVDETLVKRARKLDREIEVAQGILDSGSWELVAKAGRALTVEIDGETIELKKGGKLNRAVSASFVLSDPDGTVIDLHADASRRAAVQKLTKASEGLVKLLADVKADDINDLEERLTARDEATERIDELVDSLEEIRDDAITDSLPDPQKNASSDLEVLEDAHAAALAALEEAGDGEDPALVAARAAREQRAQQVELQEQELARSTERRVAAEQALTSARQDRSDETLDEEVTKAAAALEELGDVHEDEDVATLERSRDQLSAALEDAQRRAAQAEGRRSSAGALTTTLETLTESADALRTQFERDVREAKAARALLGLLDEARADQGDRYREPLERRIGELLTRLYGFDCRVELDDDLRIVQRSDTDSRMIPWAQLSGGAKEQAAVITGLAIAELAGDGGVPFWIDDAIVFTDDDRVEALKGLLAETTAQVIVLTCRSELAEGLPAAKLTLGGT